MKIGNVGLVTRWRKVRKHRVWEQSYCMRLVGGGGGLIRLLTQWDIGDIIRLSFSLRYSQTSSVHKHRFSRLVFLQWAACAGRLLSLSCWRCQGQTQPAPILGDLVNFSGTSYICALLLARPKIYFTTNKRHNFLFISSFLLLTVSHE